MFRPTSPQHSLFESRLLVPAAKRARLESSWAHAFLTKVLPLIDEEIYRDAFDPESIGLPRAFDAREAFPQCASLIGSVTWIVTVCELGLPPLLMVAVTLSVPLFCACISTSLPGATFLLAARPARLHA